MGCHKTAHFLAVANPASGAWLNALPIVSLGLRMDDEVVRVAVGLRFGFNLCRPHQCILCGVAVDATGTHGFLSI